MTCYGVLIVLADAMHGSALAEVAVRNRGFVNHVP